MEIFAKINKRSVPNRHHRVTQVSEFVSQDISMINTESLIMADSNQQHLQQAPHSLHVNIFPVSYHQYAPAD